ncbi:type 1 periplasmic-binding domain-containing protein [Echinicola rosea]|uniref:Uncharacterized protein n=1 Tax=Echinicola rosea TaxID=1807691 RepID=A0ABQ1V5H2_9BACT|nr:hypothetical protein [Echinicola rosea]GGF39931.1 hypothetical protein GCM10011339_30580 [Echinicola rosea]
MKVGLFIPFSGQVSSVEQEIQNGLRIGVTSDGHDEVDFAVQYYQSNGKGDFQRSLQQLESVSGVSLILAVLGGNREPGIMESMKNCRCPVVVINIAKSGNVWNQKLPHVFVNSLYLSSSQFVLANFVKDLLDQQSCVCLSKIDSTTSLLDSDKETGHVGEDLLDYCQDAMDMIKVLEVSSKSLFSASTWFLELENEANMEFVERFQRHFATIPSPYALLAYEIGLLLRNPNQKRHSPSPSGILPALQRVNVTGPRGAINLRTGSPRSSVVYVSKVGTKHKNTVAKREIVFKEEYWEACSG